MADLLSFGHDWLEQNTEMRDLSSIFQQMWWAPVHSQALAYFSLPVIFVFHLLILERILRFASGAFSFSVLLFAQINMSSGIGIGMVG